MFLTYRRPAAKHRADDLQTTRQAVKKARQAAERIRQAAEKVLQTAENARQTAEKVLQAAESVLLAGGSASIRRRRSTPSQRSLFCVFSLSLSRWAQQML